MIDGSQEYWDLVGTYKLSAIDYLRQLVIRHYQCHQQ